ncbi:TrkA C-terminal domain-containing protein [Serpentinicella alkaliphila]|uniref:TrkA family protein n=1 Tax=Serpentinicella alkaliphila TaxID=1734049 RepID=A0A4V2T1G6_9FIRM|nr:TrkA C-terminal domain-containing protein [Serpentinicella alkaliphila]QUH27151.1 TrkA C-terminal domain-containing protein [Serpentinicella alkaliphila]TCP93353.1 TrkA family protein [Serpentinicella alkaliphila]
MPITYGFIILIILALIVEVLSIALKVTGLDIDKARFQVISIITHTGFTTRESELITQHPTRRRIAMGLMLISYVGAAVLISIIVNAFQTQQTFIYFAIYSSVFLLFSNLLIRNKYIVTKFERFLEIKLRRRMKVYSKYKTVEEVLKLNDEYGVLDFVIGENSMLVGVTLQQAQLKDNYIQVLNIDRGSHIIHFPKNDFSFMVGDKVLVYGQIDRINEFIIKQTFINRD